ncbi:MAG TPA: hypothetical protein DCQ32_05400 [Cyanobacteria bacterium UBA8156]|nr:hypothetical protein [Cyanobacteria bacterium UBA8156]
MTREHELATEDLFRQEAQEYLNAIHDALLDLFEVAADGTGVDRRIDGVLSSVRSLRGEAEEAQWRGIAKLSQRLEENLQRIRLYRPQLGLKFQNLWRQALGALQAAIAAQGESPFADRIGVEATAAEALDRLELHFTEVPAGGDHWAELEHCLRLLASLREGWQEAAEAQADLVAVRESLAEVGIAMPEVAAIGQWLEEASASCQDLAQWQELGDQAIQRLQEVLGSGDGSGQHGIPSVEFGTWSPPHLLDMLNIPSESEGPFEFPDVNDTELFASEESAGTADPFAWFEPAAEAPADFFDDALEEVEETEPRADLYPTPEPNLWEEDQSPDHEDPAPAFGVEEGSDGPWPEEKGAIAADISEMAPVNNLFNEELTTAGLSGLGFGEEAATGVGMELSHESDFTAATTEELTVEGLGDWGFGEEPATNAGMELSRESDFTAATTEELTVEGLGDWGFGEELATDRGIESVYESDFTAATTERANVEGLGDVNFWQESGYESGLVSEAETMAEALAGLNPWVEPTPPEVDGNSSGVTPSLTSAERFPQHTSEVESAGDENPETSLDSLLTDLDAALPDMDDLSAMVSLESLAQPWGEEVQSLTSLDLPTTLSDGDFIDLEQTLAVAEPTMVSSTEFEALNFDLSDDVSDNDSNSVSDETQSLPALGLSNQLSDLAATFDGEPPALPNVRPVSRPVFSGVESVVFTAMEPVATALPGHQLYDVAADLGAGQIVLNWQLQQLRTAVRSLLGSSRNLGTATEAAAENSSPNGVLPEGLLRLREISEDIDLALFEMEQANADRQRQIWQVQELARDERLCSLGGLGQQLAQGLALPSVQLIVENSTAALDRAFVGKLAGPLGDLLKLLVERSVEGPAERQRLGKPATATLRMRGGAVGDTLNLEITDDGAGLPFDIFQPGAPGATIAHRCQALGIALRPDFVTGRGSRLNLQLPYVLLMVRVLLLRIGPAMVAVRTEHVRDILAAPPGDSRTVIWGHRTISWINAQDRFRVNCRRQELPVFEDPDQENVLVVLQSGDHQYALAVDACWREQEATLQRLAGGMTLSFPFCGCAVLSDSRVIPLFAPGEMLFQPNEENTQLRLLEKQKRQSAREILARRSPQLILLVDDSINVRRYLASLLESAGFATVQARDGVEALEKLDNGLQPGAIISDLEMPRMDGYTLLQRVRSREISRNVPFVVLTSRTNERHRQQAEELGATAYVNKPYRNEEMLSLMQQLTTPVTDR